MRYVLLFSFWSCGIVGLSAQRSPSGTALSPEKYASVPMQAVFDGSKTGQGDLEEASLLDYLPTVRHAGNIASEAGWAVGYYALTIAIAARENITDRQKIDELAFSALYLYNNCSKEEGSDCLAPALLRDILEWLKMKGNCAWKDFDAANPENCKREASNLQKEKALQYRIAGYDKLFESAASEQVKIGAIKYNIAAQNPVIVGLVITSSFDMIKQGSKYWQPELEKNPSIVDTISLCAVDVDNQYVTLVAPYGKNWADGGKVMLRHDQFAKYAQEGYRLVLSANAPNAKSAENGDCTGFSANFSMQLYDKTTKTFSALSPYKNNKRYELPTGVKKGRRYQLWAEDIKGGIFFYAFTLDPTGSTKVVFPEEGQSAALLSSGSRLVLPTPIDGKKQAFIWEDIGTDYVCFLVSKVEIPDLASRVSRIADDGNGDFVSRIERHLKDLLIPFDEVKYESNAPGFSTCSAKQGAVALIVRTVIEE